MKVSSTEFQKNFSRYEYAALIEPVMITRNGRDSVVVISVEEYRRLKRRDRQVIGLTDFTDADIAAIKSVRPAIEESLLDNELE